jgi:Uma2 family endonuclease
MRIQEPAMTALAQRPQKLTIGEFLAFYDTRPDEEQWQLVDGVAALTPPPAILHQMIAGNLTGLLEDGLGARVPPLLACQRIGIELLPEFPRYRPEGDVVVFEADFAATARHVDRFYLVAEILSDSDDERIELKRGFYRSHPHNQAILLIRQDVQELELDRRVDEDWATETLRGADELHLGFFGLRCAVGDLYRNTPVPPR